MKIEKCLKAQMAKCCPHLAQALQRALSNTDLPSYAPNGQRCGGEKDERTLRKGVVAMAANGLYECNYVFQFPLYKCTSK